jgi:glycosyltransferase involved in cell wall biosynthesis
LNKKIVCHITTVHNAFDTRIFYKECKSLAKYFGTVYLIAPSREDFEIDGVQIIKIPIFKNRFIRMSIGNIIAFYRAIKIHAHIYHFHDPEFLPWALLLKAATKSKVIYDVHEDYFTSIREKKWIKGGLLRKVSASIFNLVEKKSAKFFDAIVIAEDYYIENFDGKNRKIVKVLNYPILNEVLPQINFKKIGFSIVYSGTVSENRGIWNVLKVVETLSKERRDFKLYIIGKFSSENLFSNVREFLTENSLDEFVEIIGGNSYVKREIIDAYHKFMDLGLVLMPISPHYERKLPTKFFEYMLAGIPFIATKFPLWKEFVEGNKCGIVVNPDNFEEINKLIQYLIDNPDERKKMGEEGRKKVLEEYNWDTQEETLVELYMELLR